MKVDLILLVGGKGTRLREVVSDRPKPLAPIRGTPFLDLLLNKLMSSPTIGNIILATGYKSEQMQERYQTKRILISEEQEPLGTGGAIKKALPLAKSDPVFVLNGDSYIEVDFADFLDFHRRSRADITFCTREVEDVSRYGALTVDKRGRITSFTEKSARGGRGIISAGIYLMQRHILDSFPPAQFLSVETDCFPKLLDKALFSYTAPGYFIDIGTKESYMAAQKELLLD